jgi:hypothetical protein
MAEQNRIEFTFGGKICFGEIIRRVANSPAGVANSHPRGVIQHREACSDTVHRMSYLLANRNRTPL